MRSTNSYLPAAKRLYMTATPASFTTSMGVLQSEQYRNHVRSRSEADAPTNPHDGHITLWTSADQRIDPRRASDARSADHQPARRASTCERV